MRIRTIRRFSQWGIPLFLVMAMAVRAGDPDQGDRAQFENLIDRIERIQTTPGGVPELNRRLNSEIDRAEQDLQKLDEDLESVKQRFNRIAQSNRRPETDHWAYIPPVSPAIPPTKFEERVRNPIDSFVFKRLEEEGLEPSPEASKETLIRRVHLDLTGLPPTLSELTAFLEDESPDAYDKLVDRLLDSPHYGERRAQFWLDLARCADSCGYHVDANRPMWPYREWMIDAYNRDLPFNQFTIEQIAGDLLPHPSEDQIIATGFNRNTMFNEEGGIDPEEFRVKAVVDRVGTTGTIWMGTTMACAQCHDHKYDPISQKEFFELYAFYNTSSELGGGTFASRAPMIRLFEEDQEGRAGDLAQQIEKLQKTLDTHTPQLSAEQNAWERTMKRGIAWEPIEIDSGESEGGADLDLKRDGSWVASGVAPVTDIYRLKGSWRGSGISAIRLEVLPTSSGKGPNRVGRHEEGQPALSAIRLLTGPLEGASDTTPTALLFPTWNTPGQQPKQVVDSNPRSGWIFDATDLEVYEAWFEVPDNAFYPGGTRFTIELDQRAGMNSTIGRFRLTLTGAPKPVRLPPSEIQEIIEREKGYPKDGPNPPKRKVKLAALTPADSKERGRTHEEEEKISKYFRTIAASLEPIRRELEETTNQREALLNEVPQALVMGEQETPRMTFVHTRGDFLRPGEEVKPDIPSIFGNFPSDLPRNRLGLAQWLVSPENPLVSRVTVNRIWQQIFGRGIVETSEDFGMRGSPPSHPELLDWLAAELMDNDWSTRHIHRLIVMSATYRQQRRFDAASVAADPENQLLWSWPRRRLEAEAIRDSVLVASGELDRRLGGVSVPPEREEQHLRRTVYLFQQRSSMPSVMEMFDGPSAIASCSRRTVSTVALQPLYMLNSQFMERRASALADKVQETAGSDTTRQITTAFEHTLCRPPDTAELKMAAKLLGDNSVDPHQQLTQLCLALMNLNEFVYIP
ncbi:MAG: DUF1553 domain-containing protein [Candidatus Omnitrophica bacterium]|nr:DUF1553 domain-containing protein [Candidatus Omnitrophota bacterium]